MEMRRKLKQVRNVAIAAGVGVGVAYAAKKYNIKIAQAKADGIWEWTEMMRGYGFEILVLTKGQHETYLNALEAFRAPAAA